MALMSAAAAQSGPLALRGGAVIFAGKHFEDSRGVSDETYDASILNGQAFSLVQENIVRTHQAGTLRGLHYQRPPFAQDKVVSVIKGRAQFFWAELGGNGDANVVDSVILEAGACALYTPGSCAHGFLALEDDTIFSLKMSAKVDFASRGEVSFWAEGVVCEFACPPRMDLLSERDRPRTA